MTLAPPVITIPEDQNLLQSGTAKLVLDQLKTLQHVAE